MCIHISHTCASIHTHTHTPIHTLSLIFSVSHTHMNTQGVKHGFDLWLNCL